MRGPVDKILGIGMPIVALLYELFESWEVASEADCLRNGTREGVSGGLEHGSAFGKVEASRRCYVVGDSQCR